MLRSLVCLFSGERWARPSVLRVLRVGPVGKRTLRGKGPGVSGEAHRIFKDLSFKISPREVKFLSLQFAHWLRASLVWLTIHTLNLNF